MGIQSAVGASGVIDRMIEGAASPAGVILLALIGLIMLRLGLNAIIYAKAAEPATPTQPSRSAATVAAPQPEPIVYDRAA
ncbi:MAG: hypothetical protein AAGM38_00890 [Pseudomonadota bacterium]